MVFINDRFSFDKVFRNLLQDEFSHEDAKDYILDNYLLSALVFQERIENNFYLNISYKEKNSSDLVGLINEVFNERFVNKN